MDTLYIGDIPLDYHFAVFNANYIDLYSQSNLQGYLTFYRVYMYDNQFMYEKRFQNYSNTGTGVATSVSVTNDVLYRRDYPSIMFMSLTFIILLVFLFNLVSSVFKKGGLLGGLL